MKSLATPGGPTLSVGLLLPVRRALEAAGQDSVAFFDKYAITATLETPSDRIDHDLALRILEDAIALTGDPAFLARGGGTDTPRRH